MVKLLVDQTACERLIRSILAVSEVDGVGACIDMEDVSCTQKEIELFAKIQPGHSSVGIALQAYLKRTYDDIESLLHKKSIAALAALHPVSNAAKGHRNYRDVLSPLANRSVICTSSYGSLSTIIAATYEPNTSNPNEV